MFVLIHFIKPNDVEYLEERFAILTEQGWVIPQWIEDLKQSNRSIE